MAYENMIWGRFNVALKAHDEEIAAATSRFTWNPPDGQYACHVVGKHCVVVTAEGQEPYLGMKITYRIADEGALHGREFDSQLYRFNEPGIPWAKGFVQALAGLSSPPNNADEITEAIEMAVDQEFGVTIAVETSSYYNKKAKKDVQQSKDTVVSCSGTTLGAAVNETEEADDATDPFEAEEIVPQEIGVTA